MHGSIWFSCLLMLILGSLSIATITILTAKTSENSLGQASRCVSRDDNNGGTVCVCNKDYCDTIPSLQKIAAPHYQIFTSTKSGLRFKRTQSTFQNDALYMLSWNIIVNKQKTYQKIIGFGGAFTDSFGINLRGLDPSLQTEVLRSYFSEDGIEYNIARVPIGGTDFSDRGYSYDDTEEEDRTLSKFNLTIDDFKYKIPYIQEALGLPSDPLLLFAAAWIAPKWMKTNGAYAGGAIKEDLYDVWANYFIKFLDAYRDENINFWGISTGNEPALAIFGSKIPSNSWLPQQMIKWLGSLGSTIRNSSYYKNMKIMLLDDQRIFVPWIIDLVFRNETVMQYVDIIAVHWYTDWLVPPAVLDLLFYQYPEKTIMHTEACIDETTSGYGPPVLLGSWKRGEIYASSILQYLNHHVTSWTDWNMALDPTGGPTYIGNLVDSPIIINATAGEFYKQPMYYALGHFSKFIPRDSVRIELQGNSPIGMTGFIRPDGGTVIVLLNKFEIPQEINIIDDTRGTITFSLEARSISTIVYY